MRIPILLVDDIKQLRVQSRPAVGIIMGGSAVGGLMVMFEATIVGGL
jgi:hypothetical protein